MRRGCRERPSCQHGLRACEKCREVAALCNGRHGDRPNALLACVAMWWSGSDCDVDVVDEDHHDLTRVVRLGDARGTRERERSSRTHTGVCVTLVSSVLFFFCSPSPHQARGGS